jgi:hypothetical protein
MASAGDDHVIAFAHAGRFDDGTGVADLIETEHAAVRVLRHFRFIDDFEIGPHALDDKFLLVRSDILRAGGGVDLGGDGAAEAAGFPVEHDDDPFLKEWLDGCVGRLCREPCHHEQPEK